MITDIENAVKVIKSIVPENLKNPVIGIVCGSGLGTLADDLDQRFELEYNRIPGFAESGGMFHKCYYIPHLHKTVSGHKSKLAFGFLGQETKVPVVCMLGRVSSDVFNYLFFSQFSVSHV